MLDRPDRLRGEQFREEPHHHLAVLEHVRHAGRHAQVVLEHVVLALARAHDVDAGDVRVDAARHVHPLHLAAVLLVAEDAIPRHDAGGKDLLVVIDVVKERVQRVDALTQAAIEHLPFVGRNDARNDVERNQALGACVFAINRKRDSDAMERTLGLFPLLSDPSRGRPGEPARESLVVRPDAAPRGLHFVVRHAGHGRFPEGSRSIEYPTANPGPTGKNVRR